MIFRDIIHMKFHRTDTNKSQELGFPPRDARPSRFRVVLIGKMWMGRIHDRNSERFICPVCGSQTCFKHQIPWHEGITCRQYDGLDEPPRLPKPTKSPALKNLLRKLIGKPKSKGPPVFMEPFEALELERTAALMKAASRQKGQSLQARAVIRKMCKKCPGEGCGAQIERVSGCSKMKCGRCGCEFCFTCLSLWQFGHYASCNDLGIQGRYHARTAPKPK